MLPSDNPPLLVKRLSDDAILPKKISPLSAGFALSASKPTTIPPGGRAIIHTDLSIACPRGTYGRIAPRSGLAIKQGIDVGAGVIDAGYRGPVGIVIFNLDSDREFEVQKGDKIAQLILEKIAMVGMVEVEHLDEPHANDVRSRAKSPVSNRGGVGSSSTRGTPKSPIANRGGGAGSATRDRDRTSSSRGRDSNLSPKGQKPSLSSRIKRTSPKGEKGSVSSRIRSPKGEKPSLSSRISSGGYGIIGDGEKSVSSRGSTGRHSVSGPTKSPTGNRGVFISKGSNSFSNSTDPKPILKGNDNQPRKGRSSSVGPRTQRTAMKLEPVTNPNSKFESTPRRRPHVVRSRSSDSPEQPKGRSSSDKVFASFDDETDADGFPAREYTGILKGSGPQKKRSSSVEARPRRFSHVEFEDANFDDDSRDKSNNNRNNRSSIKVDRGGTIKVERGMGTIKIKPQAINEGILIKFSGESRNSDHGPAGCGWAMYEMTMSGDCGMEISHGGMYLGEDITCNQAEYEGLREGLEYFCNHDIRCKELRILGDSELAIHQLVGRSPVSGNDIRTYYVNVLRLLEKIPSRIEYEYINSSENVLAKNLAKDAIDQYGKGRR